MMNALPLPTRPTEIPGGVAKTGKPAPNIRKCERAEEPSSFASTLQAVHEKHPSKCDAGNEHSDETQARGEIAEGVENDSGSEESETAGDETSAQVMPTPVIPSERPAGEDGQTALIEGITDEGAQATAENTGIAQSDQDDTGPIIHQDGIHHKEAGLDDKPLTNRKFASQIKEQKGQDTSEKNPKIEPGMSSQGPIEPCKATQTATNASDAAHKLAAMGADSAKPLDQQLKDPAQNKTVDAGLKVLGGENSEKAQSMANTLSGGHRDAGENGQPETDRFANQLKSRLVSGGKEERGDTSKGGLPPGPRTVSNERSSTGETNQAPSTTTGAPVREALFTIANEAIGQAADQHGQDDPALSFTNVAATGKTATATSSSTGTTTAFTGASEQLHQDNFHQLVERAMFMVRGEQSEARIALKPDQLGHVQMRVITEHHSVSIKIMTESPAARDLIDAHAHQLKSELQQQGLTVERIEVSVSDGQGDAYRGERQRESFLRQMASEGESKQEEDSDMPRPDRPQPSSGRNRTRGIDYFA
jgi:flagellar hook-length control protein FliK